MTVAESDRLALHEKMKEAPGRKEADTLMDILPPTQWKDIASKDDIAALRQDVVNLGIELRGELGGEIGSLRSELHTEIGGLRSELHTEIGGLRSELLTEIGGLRNEMIDRFAAADRKQTALLVGFALTMWLGQTATILTVVYAG